MMITYEELFNPDNEGVLKKLLDFTGLNIALTEEAKTLFKVKRNVNKTAMLSGWNEIPEVTKGRIENIGVSGLS